MKKLLLTLILVLVCATQYAQDVEFSFENPQITNDGTDDFYEVDVFIKADDPFKYGFGQFYLDYNTAAFGMTPDVSGDFFFEQPAGSLLDIGIDAAAGAKFFSGFNTNDNIPGIISLNWQHTFAASTISENTVTATPRFLCHVRFRFMDVNQDPMVCFNESLTTGQNAEACGPFVSSNPFEAADCTNHVAVVRTEDTYDCSGSIISEGCIVKTWNGSNWNPAGNPTATDHVVISDDYDTATDGGSITACEITIDSGVILDIASDEFLSVVNNITVNGTLNVAQIANVVQIDDTATVTNNGTINVYVDTPDLDGRDFMLLGSPMSMETRADVFVDAIRVRNHLTEEFSPNTEVGDGSPGAGNWVDETGNDWPVLENGAINPGEGYMVMRELTGPPAPLNLNFNTGTLNNGVVNYSAGYNGNQNSSPSILANPYASAISATDFITTNAGGVDAVYFWEHITSPNAGLPGPFGLNYTMEDISIFNLTGGTAAAGSDPSTVPNGIISTGQGFGVKVTSAGGAVPIVFNNAMRRTTGNAMPRNQNDDRIWLHVQSEEYNLNSTALIGFLDQATDGIDPGYDAKRLATNVSLYSHLDDGSDILGIQARGAFEVDVKIPMGFASLIDEKIDYTITIQNIEGLNLATATVYLIDTLEDVITNLSESNYTFTSEKGIYNNRFVLQFVPEVILGTNNPLLETVAIYPNPTHAILNIVSSKATIVSVRVFDLLGRVVLNTSDLSSNKTQVDLTELNSAMYFVEINTEEGKVTERIIKD